MGAMSDVLATCDVGLDVGLGGDARPSGVDRDLTLLVRWKGQLHARRPSCVVVPCRRHM